MTEFSTMDVSFIYWDDESDDEKSEKQPAQSIATHAYSNDPDEARKIQALLENPNPLWSRQNTAYEGQRGWNKRRKTMNGNAYKCGMYEEKNPPPGYVCHRCNRSGHFIRHCPTNGDPSYDRKRPINPIGIPKSMLAITPDGSYTLQSGDRAVLQPDEAAFKRAIEGIPTLCVVEVSTDHLPECVCCSLCKKVMEDAVIASKCCFWSYCNKCIRDHIICKSECACGAKNVLIDHLLPNKAVRYTIIELLDAASSSQETASSGIVPTILIKFIYIKRHLFVLLIFLCILASFTAPVPLKKKKNNVYMINPGVGQPPCPLLETNAGVTS